VDLEIARAHARIAAELAAQGTPIEVHDVWLAATCVVHDLTIVTANIRDFERVAGLRVESWPVRT
jgi:tRNA(fMet)-specific endonuclease VapC